MTGGRTVILAAIMSVAFAEPAPAADGFQVIVNSGHSGQAINRLDLAKIFLKHARRWGDGAEIVAVDQSMRSPVRKAFTSAVLRSSNMKILNYWRTQIRRGQSFPPQVKASDSDVISFVAATPGSIGYISPRADLPEDVQVLLIIETSS